MRIEVLLFALTCTLVFSPVWGSIDLPFTRALYGHWNYTLMSSVGFDGDYDNYWWSRGPESVMRKFDQNSLEAAASNITHIAGLFYWGGDWLDYVNAVDYNGEEVPRVPSPVDETYWLGVIEEPALAIANLSLSRPIWGIVWDFELYLYGSSWNAKDYSYDEPALRAFANASGNQIPSLAPSQRYKWLVNNGLLDEFNAWQKEGVYSLAKSTEEKVHAINPNLSLGILGFNDCWRFWTTLEAFATPSAPVTAWTEDTYGGYNEARIDSYRKAFEDRGLNGRVIPGFYSIVLSPWDMITNMERATRHSGAFWLYSAEGYKLADEEAYRWAYGLLQTCFYFNRSRAEPLPVFDLYPGVEVRPYLGPETVTILLEPHRLGSAVSDSVTLVSDSGNLGYVGDNLSIMKVGGQNQSLGLGELPCFVYGLSEEDVLATEVWNIIHELESLMEFYDRLGLEELAGVKVVLDVGKEDFSAGRYEDARSRLLPTRSEAYDLVFDRIGPLIDMGLASPRDSPIPLASLSKICNARKMLSESDLRNGRMYLLVGLKEWSLAISEPSYVPIILTGLMVIFLVHRRGFVIVAAGNLSTIR